MLSDCVNVMVYLEYTFVIGLSATSQEMLSMAQGAEYTLLNVIGFVLYIISQTPWFVTHSLNMVNAMYRTCGK